MARRFAKRSENGGIIGSVKWPHPDYPEEIDDQDADFLAYMDRVNNPPQDDAPLSAEELYDMLEAKGQVGPQDRPRPKKK